MIDLSVVIPVRDEQENVAELVARLTATLEVLGLSYELIFVTDRNRDNTLGELKALNAADGRVKLLKLSNSFGHHAAVMAGLAASAGKAVVIMDGDLQDLPEDIATLYRKMAQGYDVVYGVKEKKNESTFRNWCSRTFLWLLGGLSDQQLDFNTSMFRIVSRRVASEVLRFKEGEPSLTFIMGLVGFPTTWVPVSSGRRLHGRTKYNFLRQLNFAITSLLSFSTKPLRIISVFGMCVSTASLLYFLIVLAQWLLRGIAVPGWATLAVLLSFLGGAILMAQGITGEYIARVFLETKNRPLYIVEERVGWGGPG